MERTRTLKNPEIKVIEPVTIDFNYEDRSYYVQRGSELLIVPEIYRAYDDEVERLFRKLQQCKATYRDGGREIIDWRASMKIWPELVKTIDKAITDPDHRVEVLRKYQENPIDNFDQMYDMCTRDLK